MVFTKGSSMKNIKILFLLLTVLFPPSIQAAFSGDILIPPAQISFEKESGQFVSSYLVTVLNILGGKNISIVFKKLGTYPVSNDGFGLASTIEVPAQTVLGDEISKDFSAPTHIVYVLHDQESLALNKLGVKSGKIFSHPDYAQQDYKVEKEEDNAKYIEREFVSLFDMGELIQVIF